MLRSCILDKRRPRVILGGLKNLRMFSTKQTASRAIPIAEAATRSNNLPYRTSIFNNYYWVRQQVRTSCLAMKQYLPGELPYIFHKRAPKGFEKFFRDKKEQKKKDETQKDKDDKESQKDKESESEEEHHDTKSSKTSDDRPAYMQFLFNPNNNPKWENWGILALALFGGIYAYTFSSPAKELVYMEFVNDYLTKNRVKNITIIKDKRSDVFNYRADIETMEGDKFYITLGSVSHTSHIEGFEKFLRDKKEQKKKDETQKDKDDKESQKDKESESEEEHHDTKSSKTSDDRPAYMQFLFNPNNNPKWENWGILVLALFGGIYAYTFSSPVKELVYMEFVNDYLMKNRVKNITIIKDKRSDVFNYRADIETMEGDKFYITLGSVDNFLAKIDLIQREMGKTPQEFVPLKYSNESEQSSSNLFLNITIAGLFGLFMYQIWKGRTPKKGTGRKGSSNNSKSGGFMGGGGLGSMMNVGKSNVQIYGIDKKIKTKFKHVAGLENAKMEIMEFVDFLKNPKKYQKLGAKIPRGALLIGPPGTGKTMLAKATAGEAGIPFMTISGSDFVEMFVGVGASRVRDLFKKARENSPSIIFIDEIDAVGKKRHGKFTGGNDERDNTLNQLLVEMDGFGTDSAVVVFAATNRKDILDSALLRPGRFDRTIEINLPNIEERAEIFKVHLKKVKLNEKYDISEYAKKLAALTPGMSGADIYNVANEGAILAARANLGAITLLQFEQATERVIGGLEKKTVMSETERRTVAYHESGHAVAGWFLENSNPLLKITIIPRTKGSLGFAQYLPEELSLYTKEQLYDMIKVALGGRIAEEIFFGRITTGASDDLKKVTQIATGIVTTYGMSDMGLVSYHQEEGYQKPYSENTGSKIDVEVKNIIDECYKNTKVLLESKRELIEKLAERLLDKEVVSLPDIIECLGERPFPMKENLKEYLAEIKERQKEEKEEAAKKEEEGEESEEGEKSQESEEESTENEDLKEEKSK